MKYDVDGHAPKTPMLFLYQNGFHNATNARNGVIKKKCDNYQQYYLTASN
jgi:hypothetical protein